MGWEREKLEAGVPQSEQQRAAPPQGVMRARDSTDSVDFTPERLYTATRLNYPSLHSWNPGSSELEISPEKAITLILHW